MVVASLARSNSSSSQKPLTNGVVILGNGHLGLAQPDSRRRWSTRGGSVCGCGACGGCWCHLSAFVCLGLGQFVVQCMKGQREGCTTQMGTRPDHVQAVAASSLLL